MRSGWTRKRLDELAQFTNGLWKGEEPPFVHVGVIRNTNFTKDGALDDTDIAYLDVEARKFEKRRLQFGDLILEKSGGGPKQPVGRVVFFDKAEGDFSFSNFTAAIRVLDPTALDPRYLHKYLHWVYVSGRTETMQSHSTGIRNLSGDAYKGINVDYPDLPKQRRIVTILDEAFRRIAITKRNTERGLLNAIELANAIGEACFDRHTDNRFQPRQLVDLCELIVDCEHKTAPTQEDGYPSIRTSNIGKGELLLDEVNRVSEETYAAWTRRAVPRPGDLILAREAPAGNVAVIPAGMQVCLGQRTVLIRPRSDVFEPEYLAHLLLQRRSQRRLLAHSRGATVQHVNMKDIRALMIESVPSLGTQRRVVQKLAAVSVARSSLLEALRRKLTALDELQRSLLNDAFSGKLSAATAPEAMEEAA